VLSSPIVGRQTDTGRGAGAASPFRGRCPAACRVAAVAVAAAAAFACGVTPASERLSQARHLSADLLVQFTKAADAANMAVMADTDDASAAFAREADRAGQSVHVSIDALKPVLEELRYSDETRLLQEFDKRFHEYRELDRRILDLAVANTNLKAQRLSFGPAREQADAFRDALQGVVPSDAGDSWRVKALVATAVAAVREIQALQAPHIADAADDVMTRIEGQMETCAAGARHAIETLPRLVPHASRTRLANANAALDRFMELNAQIVALSRRNTNVRSLALALNEKGKLTAACEDSLRAIREALAQRGFTGTR
jgi:hypothetical protein